MKCQGTCSINTVVVLWTLWVYHMNITLTQSYQNRYTAHLFYPLSPNCSKVTPAPKSHTVNAQLILQHCQSSNQSWESVGSPSSYSLYSSSCSRHLSSVLLHFFFFNNTVEVTRVNWGAKWCDLSLEFCKKVTQSVHVEWKQWTCTYLAVWTLGFFFF